MSVWDAIVGQQAATDMLSAVAAGDRGKIAQSWLICGPAGAGREQVARAFAAALESPDHGLNDTPTNVTRQVLAGSHPDVHRLTTNKVTIGIDEVRDIIGVSEQMPSTAPWRVIIIEDVDRMLERTTNVLLKEIEEPSAHCIWLLCAPSAQDVLPTIRSRTRIVNLAVPGPEAIAAWLARDFGTDAALAERVARLCEGNLKTAELYATEEKALSDRDELVAGVLRLSRASDAVLLAGNLNKEAKEQAEKEAERWADEQREEFRRVNGLREGERVPVKLRGVYNAIGKKEDVKRRATRLSRDVLLRALDAVASVHRDVTVLQNHAEEAVGLINLEHRASLAALAERLGRDEALARLDEVAVARRRLTGNGNPVLVLEALFCALL